MNLFERQFDQRKPQPIRATPSRLLRAIDRNPRSYINWEIVRIISSAAMIFAGFLWIAKGMKTGNILDLALGVWIAAGVLGILTGFYNINFAVKRLQANAVAAPGPTEAERSELLSPRTL